GRRRGRAGRAPRLGSVPRAGARLRGPRRGGCRRSRAAERRSPPPSNPRRGARRVMSRAPEDIRVSAATDIHVLLRAFVDELARCGLRAACTSPGSRCAPLVLALARDRHVCCYSHVDERCAGFFALGMAKASGVPVAVTCTSGTAAAELLPAAIEARQAPVPPPP